MSQTRRWPGLLLIAAVVCLASAGRGFAEPSGHATVGHAEAGHADAGHKVEMLGNKLPSFSVFPFAVLLLSIAVFPLAAGHWWEHNRNKAIIVALLSVPIAFYMVTEWGDEGVHELTHKAKEYVSFIALLGSLYVISGGIYVQGSLSGTPLVNSAMLGLGAVLANFVGTTGASMLLIRPMLRANAPRQKNVHIFVFFIFIVSNCGGLLTPLGDPPLFLGFLSGVPFGWTLGLWKEWLLVNTSLLVVFNVWDQVVFNREEKERPGSQLEEVQRHEPLKLRGAHNILFLAGVIAAIYGAGRFTWPFGVQEGLLAALTAASYLSTSREIHEKNRFNVGPINEVAIVFAGIFVTMTPALLILNANGHRLGVDEPWEFFWITGLLSSVLDNAPTYLTFAAAACGINDVPLEGRYLQAFLALPASARTHEILSAIACGAVFMGANTYIGNGPNFMVKAIAEGHGVKMPGFFSYIVYALCVLIPLFVIVTFAFFR